MGLGMISSPMTCLPAGITYGAHNWTEPQKSLENMGFSHCPAWVTVVHSGSPWSTLDQQWTSLGSMDIRHPEQRVQREPLHTSKLLT
jgi:hypothetical protein